VLRSSYASWETLDGDDMTFAYRSSLSGRPLDRYRGDARLTAERAGGQADFREPSPGSLELPEGTLFPTEHAIELIARAAAGERFFTANLFDGSEGATLDEVVATIGQRADPPEAA